MGRRRKGLWFALLACVTLLVALVAPRGAYADGDAARHSVVVIEAGWLINGEWTPMPELKEKHDPTYDPDDNDDFLLDDNDNLVMVHPRGTAFFVGKKGENPQYLITNHHVIDYYVYWKAGQRNTFTYEDGSTVVLKSSLRMYYDSDTYDEVYFVDTDESMDLSILRLDSPTDQREALVISDPVDASEVRAIGFPGLSDNHYAASVTKWGEKDATITFGGISKLYTEAGNGRRMIQTDAVVSTGSSGGALLDSEDRVVGVTSESVTDGDAKAYYAVSMEMARPMLDMHGIAYDYVPMGSDVVSGGGTIAESEGDTTESTVRIVWSDGDNADKKRPAEVIATLSNGRTAVLNEANNWSQTLSDLATVGEDGNPIAYTWSIPAVEGYEGTDPVVGATTTTFSFKHEPAPTINFLLIGGIAAVVLVAIAAIILVVRSRSKGGMGPTYVPPQPPQGDNGSGFNETRPANKVESRQPIRNDSGFRVQGVSGSQAGKRYSLPTSGKIVIGRDKNAGIVVPDGTPGVSARHCEVWTENNRVYIRDLGSKYGTFVDPGVKLAANQDYELAEGQAFWLADNSERYQIAVKRG